MSLNFTEPESAYQQRRQIWQAEADRAEQEFRRLGNWRLLAGLLTLLVGFVFLKAIAVPILALIALAIRMSRVRRIRERAQRALGRYEHLQRRLHGQWRSHGRPGTNYAPKDHIYVEDLDVLGAGSLFELLADTRSKAGERLLASWLLAPAELNEILARQAAWSDLKDRLSLREDLAMIGEDAAVTANLEGIQRWAARPPVTFSPIWRFVAPVLAISAALLVFAFFGQLVRISAVLAILAVNACIYFGLRSKVEAALTDATVLGQGLPILGQMMERLSREEFSSPRLQALQASMNSGSGSGATQLVRLQRWVDWQASSEHMLVRLVRLVLLWDPQVAFGLEHWRQQFGQELAIWLRDMAELEALLCFSAIAFENPAWTAPELSGSGTVRARDMVHPLLPTSEAVPNDLQLGEQNRLLIVSGSNMSGKSTLMRALGLNTVLALAGGPVAASSFQVGRLYVGASIRVSDSTLDHRSRFMAEILRLQQIVSLCLSGTPVLFLLDEILSGTNSHDRRVGAEGIVRKLLSTQSIGIITTHDLALTELERDLGGLARNAHLEDELVDGQLHFDYRLKPGIVTRSNALELMRQIGLAV